MSAEQNHIASWGRLFVRAVIVWAERRGYSYELLFGEWVIRLEKNGVVQYVTHSELGLNTSVSDHIVADKSTTYYILNRAGVPALEHTLFLRPGLKGWSSEQDILVHNFFDTHPTGVVVKPNAGAQGEDVTLVRNEEAGRMCMETLFTEYRALALSPFQECIVEYRTTVLDGEVLHMYEKHHAPDPNEFRFNLSHGAIAEEVTSSDFTIVSKIACDAAKAVGIRFANVDIMKTADGRLLVIEINADVTFTYYARTSAFAYDKAIWIFGRALDRLFHIS